MRAHAQDAMSLSVTLCRYAERYSLYALESWVILKVSLFFVFNHKNGALCRYLELPNV